MECDVIKDLVGGNVFNKEIEFGKCRYTDLKLIEFLDYFRKFRKIPSLVKFKNVDFKNCENNVCYTRKTRDLINSKYFKEIVVGSRCTLIKNYLNIDKMKGFDFMCSYVDKKIVKCGDWVFDKKDVIWVIVIQVISYKVKRLMEI